MTADYVANSAVEARRLEMDPRPVEVIAFGSQLLYGSVGLNPGSEIYRQAQLRHIPVPTIILSNLPHYPSVHALNVDGKWLEESLADLTSIGALDELKMVTVGYLASPLQAQIIADWYLGLGSHELHPPLIVDPTLGDYDVGFYTDPAVAQGVKECLLPLATGITPNRFELSCLSQRELSVSTPIAEVIEVAWEVMGEAIQWAVITGNRSACGAHVIDLVLTEGRERELTHPQLSTSAKGQGDIFTSSVVAALLNGENIEEAAVFASSQVRQQIMQRQ